MKRNMSSFITENLSYKIVALFIALVLWFTILGRRDFVYTKNIDLEFHTAPGMALVTQSVENIRIRVSGPRSALKKFMESASTIPIDLSQMGEGISDVDVPYSKVDVPLGIKVLSVRPNVVRVELIKSEKSTPPAR